jgi:hypothetical protein
MAANPREAPRRADPANNGANPAQDPPRKLVVPKAADAPQEPRRKVVVVPTEKPHADRLNWVWALLAAFVSLAFHALLLFAIYHIEVNSLEAKEKPAGTLNTKPPPPPTEEQKKEKEEAEKPLDLTETTPGDPEQKGEINYLVPRVEVESVPGPVNIHEEQGVQGALPEAPRQSIPPPPGDGGGSGGALLPPSADGTGSRIGLPGGYPIGTSLGSAFEGRSGSTKQYLLSTGGGNEESEQRVAEGLRWLALHQCPDGHWSMNEFHKYTRDKPFPAGSIATDKAMTGMGTQNNDVAATALALLPFLAAGQTHRAPKEEQKHDYSKGINAGLYWLIAQQSKSDGSFPGGIYAHGIASIVLCEAYGLTSDPAFKAPAQRALNYLVSYQHAEGGGWRYSKNQPGDMSVTGWQLMALKSGQMAGLSVPAATLRGAERFVDSCEDPNHKGCYSYVPGGGRSYAMTATGMLCRQYLGVNPRNPKLMAGVDFIKTGPPGKTGDLYYEYYATQVMHHMGGDAWDFWNEGPGGKGSRTGIRDTLIDKMEKDEKKPTFYGSWNFASGHTASGGRIMSTSLALLCLEVYYRHLPLYRTDLGVVK